MTPAIIISPPEILSLLLIIVKMPWSLSGLLSPRTPNVVVAQSENDLVQKMVGNWPKLNPVRYAVNGATYKVRVRLPSQRSPNRLGYEPEWNKGLVQILKNGELVRGEKFEKSNPNMGDLKKLTKNLVMNVIYGRQIVEPKAAPNPPNSLPKNVKIGR